MVAANPAILLSGVVLQGPEADGSSGRVLTTNGAGVLSFGDSVVLGGSNVVRMRLNAHASQTANILEVYNASSALRARISSLGDFSNSQGQTNSEIFGAGATITNQQGVVFGNSARVQGDQGVAVGYSSLAGADGTAIGWDTTATGAFGSIALGKGASSTHNGSIVIGNLAASTAANQLVIGSNLGGIGSVFIGNGVTNAAPVTVVLNATGGSGTNIAGANLNLAAGRPTGSGAGGHIRFQTAPAGSSGTALQSLVTICEITDTGELLFADGKNIAVNATTGTKIGTATTQKLSLWNQTPIVQPSSTGETSGHTPGSGIVVDDESVFTGGNGSSAYTISDIVKHLKAVGIIAA